MCRVGIAVLAAVLLGACTSGGGGASASVSPPSQSVTLPRTPDPAARDGSVPPELAATAPHADPSLEAQIPDRVGGYVLWKSSWTGVELLMTDADPLLAPFGKHQTDLSAASGVPGMPALFEISVQRLQGVPADRLLAVLLAQTPDAKITPATLAGRRVTHVEYTTGLDNWDYTTGQLLFEITGPPDSVAAALAALP